MARRKRKSSRSSRTSHKPARQSASKPSSKPSTQTAPAQLFFSLDYVLTANARNAAPEHAGLLPKEVLLLRRKADGEVVACTHTIRPAEYPDAVMVAEGKTEFVAAVYTFKPTANEVTEVCAEAQQVAAQCRNKEGRLLHHKLTQGMLVTFVPHLVG